MALAIMDTRRRAWAASAAADSSLMRLPARGPRHLDREPLREEVQEPGDLVTVGHVHPFLPDSVEGLQARPSAPYLHLAHSLSVVSTVMRADEVPTPVALPPFPGLAFRTDTHLTGPSRETHGGLAGPTY